MGSISMKDYEPIPGPPGVPVLGNMFDIDAGASTTSFYNMARKYGEISQIKVPGVVVVLANSAALVTEISTDDRFRKLVEGGLIEMRHALHNGLLTADTTDPAWHSAHRIAMPGLTPVRIREMFGGMKDIVSQLCLKWARLGPSHSVDVNVEFTRMALDIIGLCGMGYRFNTFYDQTDSHPIAVALNRFLKEVDARSWRIPFMNSLHLVKKKKFFEDINFMRSIAQNLIDHRRANPGNQDDILGVLMKGVDPETGATMSDGSVIDNLLTFIGAGHETTSGTLSFVLFFLIQNPTALVKAQKEVDSVIGDDTLKVEHLSKLPYIDAILRETLRFHPTVPVYTRTCDEDQVIGGKYLIKKNTPVLLNLFASQRDTKVYGDDADQWKPERMLGDSFKQLPAGAWRPFGTGIRACIGRAFAWQESQIALAMILHAFNFEAVDPNYKLKCKDAITLNPLGFKIRAHLRNPARYTSLLRDTVDGQGIDLTPTKISPTPSTINNDKPITILYGSDQGNARSLAHFFASHASDRGFQTTVQTLNTAKENLPKDRPVVIFTSSYNGEPPLTAAHFVSWLESLSSNEISGVSYAVFGCGHRDWSKTFQRIPTLIDGLMAQRGGIRIIPLSSTDASDGEVLSNFQDWEEQSLWPAILGKSEKDVETDIVNGSVKMTIPGLLSPQQELSSAYVSSSKLLTKSGKPEKVHMELDLPSGSSYNVGDYIVVAPVNPAEVVRRVLSRLNLAWDSVLDVNSSITNGVSSTKYTANEVFSNNVELSHPASVRNLKYLSNLADDESTKQALTQLMEHNGTKQLSVLDIIEEFKGIDLTVYQFLSMLPPLLVRTYSISSSPLHKPNKATITFSIVVKSPKSGGGNPSLGVTSNYLSGLKAGAIIRQSIRTPRTNFVLPIDPSSTPVIMICAGSGIAPFRGFVQERYIQLQEGRNLAPALLFFGCRSSDLDDLYRDEFDIWERAGAVTVHRAFSRLSHTAGKIGVDVTAGIPKRGSYVQDILQKHDDQLCEMWSQGARCYVCGAAKMADEVRAKFETIVGALSEQDLKGDRFLTEIFS